jgi:hypothetical protein
MADPIGQYTRREMLELVRLRPRPTTFLQSMFVKREQIHGTKILEIDQIFGGRVSAGYVNRQDKGHVVGKGGFKNLIHIAPYVKELYDYTSSDVDERLAGQTQYESGPDPIAAFISEALADIEDRIIRLEEAQLAEALISGTVTVTGKGVDYTVDFGQAVAHKIALTGTARWTESTGDIIGNLQTWSLLPVRAGSKKPNVLVADVEAMELILANTTIKALLDNRRVDIGMINPREIAGQDADYVGHIAYPGFSLDLYTYQGERVVVSAGTPTSTPYLDSHRVILTNTEMDCRRHYGKIENLLCSGFRGKRFVNQWMENDGSTGHMSIESAPLIGLHEPSAVVSALVTAGS